jgi:hypothetical protein
MAMLNLCAGESSLVLANASSVFYSPLHASVRNDDKSTKGIQWGSEKPAGPGQFIERMPALNLTCIEGNKVTSNDLFKQNGMLLMITAPNLEQYEKQKRWDKQIRKAGWPEANAPRCVVLQDLSQQETYRERAIKMITEKAQEDKLLTFVIDNTGDLRRSFNVHENETVLLLIDKDGNVVHHEHNDVEPDPESARRVSKLAKAMSSSSK